MNINSARLVNTTGHRLANKVVILAAGLGTRMRRADETVLLDESQRRIAETGLKAMIPIDRPFLDYVIHEVADAGCTQVCLVIGPEHDEVRDYYHQQITPSRLNFSFAIQHERLGTAHALQQARQWVRDDPFIMLNSDNLYPAAALAALRSADGPALVVYDRRVMMAQGNISEERLASFALVSADDSGYLADMIEKPDPSQMSTLGATAGVSMNCWRFSPTIFEAIQRIKPSPRGELEIPDAVRVAIDEFGERFRTLHCDQPVLDISRQSDIPSVARQLSGRRCEL